VIEKKELSRMSKAKEKKAFERCDYSPRLKSGVLDGRIL